jgi:hypothetical protein
VVECDLDHRRPRSFLLLVVGELRRFRAALDFVTRGEANLTRSFSRTDLARPSAAVGNPLPRLGDVEHDPVGLPRPKMAQDAADADAEFRLLPARRSRDIIQHGMVDDLGRSCERRLNPPQMCQLISMPSCAIEEGFPLRLAVKSSPRWKTLSKPWIRFLVGRVGAETEGGNISPQNKPGRHAG